MHTIPVFLCSLFCVLFALYLFIIVIRIFALLRLSRFFGEYAHITPANEQPDDVTFTISYSWSEAYGWHHLYLFDKPDTRIIMNLFHVKDNKQIISNEGYYIVKK